MPKFVSGTSCCHGAALDVDDGERIDAGWTVCRTSAVPSLADSSTFRHSRSVRTLTDVPAVGGAVSLRVCYTAGAAASPLCDPLFHWDLAGGRRRLQPPNLSGDLVTQTPARTRGHPWSRSQAGELQQQDAQRFIKRPRGSGADYDRPHPLCHPSVLY